ncbi:MAG TPA: FimV/HubP family polar landmark protein [Steroidobacteraceae bacterium]|nr:FimV/HubP family polar landmark protein [Steroidobacteraceae bacterium]
MSLTMPRLMLLACLLSPSFLWPSSAWALGLGEIHLNSALNEPMNAEIDLIAASQDELVALRATLAGREAFTRYGIDRPPFLSTLTFKVGKGKDGRDALLVRSSDAIPEPFVTFLVDVNWARGHLMREYTVLLDPPVYTPGETASSAAPVTAPTVSAPPARRAASAPAASASSPPTVSRAPASAPSTAAASETAGPVAAGGTYRVSQGDTLTKIARSLHANAPAAPGNIDQTMMAVYRANPDAFGGNINILRRGAVLRIPGADDIAALNQTEAISEVHRQMSAWRGAGGASAGGHLRLVTPSAGGGATGSGDSGAANAEAQALKDRVKDLEAQLAASHRLIDIRNSELSALQRKLGVPPTAPAPSPAPAPAAPAPAQTTPAPSVAAVPPPATAPAASTPTPVPPSAQSTSTPTPIPAPAPVVKKKPAAAPAAESGSWIDWVAANWWVPAAVIIALIVVLAFAAWRRRQDGAIDLNRLDGTDISEFRDPPAKSAAGRKGDDSFVVEESGEHRAPDFDEPDRLRDTHSDIKAPEDTMSSESAVNLDQGDPLAEADFHMAYGLYDQAADLVRIALEREPDRRDLRLKLLEIYFVWGNKDAFLQTAKGLEATRDRAPAGEWDKIVIMGKQICPDEPLFASTAGSGRGAGALVDLNLEGGENRVDIDLFGEPEGEHGRADHAKESADMATTGESPAMRAGSDLDFTLDTPERGADDSPTRDMPPRDEPTVESELMNFADAPTAESPALKSNDVHDRISSKLGPVKADQTAEVSIDDLGLDLDQLEETGSPAVSGSHLEETDHPAASGSPLEETDHPADMPTMVAGLDEKSRRMMAEAENRSRDRDLTELERELEASFVADLGSDHEEIKTAVLGPESAPTVQMPRADVSPTTRFKSPEFSDVADPEKIDGDSTSRLRALAGAAGLSGDSIDLDLDRLANALGSGDTVEQPRAEDEVFSSEVFEASQRNRRVDLDVGDAMNGAEAPTNKLTAINATTRSTKLKPDDHGLPPELEPVTMSEVGTKLDLARAYMDMGDPEGARSILEEVVHEGSASQKQEAQRLIETLPG